MNKELLNIAIEASLAAGEEIMKIYAAPIEVFTKEDDSPLTLADKNANDIINSFLKPTAIPIISEENKQLDYADRKDWGLCWVVDPVDGTKEFIKRNGEFTVNIALVKDGAPVLGVIYVPDFKELYYADVAAGLGYKACLEEHDTTLDEVRALSQSIAPGEDNTAIRVVGSRSHLNQETQDFIDQIKTHKEKTIVSKGSSLKFCLVAEGKADVYPRYAPTMEWDTAAGQAICEAVGVQVLALPERTPLRYNKENLLNPWFLVSK